MLFLNCLLSTCKIVKIPCSTQVNFRRVKQQFPWWPCSHCEMHQHTCFVYQAKRISHLGLFPTVIKAEDSKTALPSEDAATTWTQALLKTKLCYQFPLQYIGVWLSFLQWRQPRQKAQDCRIMQRKCAALHKSSWVSDLLLVKAGLLTPVHSSWVNLQVFAKVCLQQERSWTLIKCRRHANRLSRCFG